jgi:hypothetical protein
VQTAGRDAGVWCGEGQRADFPPDQRAEDALSATWTSEPLDERIELLGRPEVTLRLRSDRPQALVAVRLCEVSPEGWSALVTRGVLNLAHRADHGRPQAVPVGEAFDVTVELDAVARAIPRGSRLRVAVSSTYWPWLWPSPEPVVLEIREGEVSELRLPVRPPSPGDDRLRPFDEPEQTPGLRAEVLRPGVEGRSLRQDVAAGVHEQVFDWDLGGLVRLSDIDLEAEDTSRTTFRIVEGDPLSAQVRVDATTSMCRGGWSIRAEIVSTMSADAERWHLTTQLDAYEGEARVFAKTWSRPIPRDHV